MSFLGKRVIHIQLPSLMPKMPVLVFEIYISPCERINQWVKKKVEGNQDTDDLMGIKGIQDLEDLIGK